MCGFAGFLDASKECTRDQLASDALAMAGCLRHRGPDDEGVWVDPAAGIALGHRRLSIVDLSASGHQPMESAGGRYVVAYNGEVYNFPALRRELEGTGHRFRGHSDTEILLAAVEEWGVAPAVRRLVGMFAFALWDRRERALFLCRDRLGEKPLYYGWMGGSFLFGSELKALRAHPAWRGEVDRDALALYMRHAYIPAPYSIHREVRKLQPGTILELRGASPGTLPAPVPYWTMEEVVARGAADPFRGSEEEAAAELERLLRDAVAQQMVADVPLGAFLSGGVDSSAIVALMQAQSARPVRTFTLGFHEPGFNEAEHARAVAEHLGTEHTELYVTADEARGVIPLLPGLYDEPFADSSQIPTFLVARLARSSVTVSLSGDGGDELFGGYNRYFQGRRIWNSTRWMPGPLRASAAGLVSAVSPGSWDRIGSRLRQPQLADRARKLAGVLGAATPEAVYSHLVSSWTDPVSIVRGAQEPPTPVTDSARRPEMDDFTERMMYLDTVTYLAEDILTKVDRAAMGVALETRVPFLHHPVVEFAWRLPLEMKVRGGQGKRVLRRVLYRHVPRALIERPKVGFAVPVDRWLRGPLREWAEELLDERRLNEEGFLRPAPIRSLWRQHLRGERNAQQALWCVLMFQAWLEASRAGAPGRRSAGPPPAVCGPGAR
ncbi:MAG: Asparagine synthetase [glutamine-hydrolyzing] [uncultured Gemmatimonadetes bacterium]|uniref:asparagine synthase (glutamine-hydrolyzing) n=1 Tax=uncultured Gemmatimonadota bacterium TaxID=203437 RepID=A0A6J4MML3_9BACT|nr:MAG: Asparagine synthetase [glutamine-hydrolyzing] [uncultured Gemmatimonadota bacterium]